MIVSNLIFTRSSTNNNIVLVNKYALIRPSEKFCSQFKSQKWILINDDTNTMQFVRMTNISNIYLLVLVIDKSHYNRNHHKNSKPYLLQTLETWDGLLKILNKDCNYYTVPIEVVSKFNGIHNDKGTENTQNFLEVIGDRIIGLARKTQEILEN